MNIRYDIEKGIIELDLKHAIIALAKQLNLSEEEWSSVNTPSNSQRELIKLEQATVDVTLFKGIIGALIHISTTARPDICHSVSSLATHGNTPGEEHLQAAYQIVKYLYKTKDLCIRYERIKENSNDVIQDSSKTLDLENIKPLISTDPPYYDNINYAELSDYFYDD